MGALRTNLLLGLVKFTVIAQLAQSVAAREKEFDSFGDYQGLVLDEADNQLTLKPK